jgi:hypothetical protein
VVPKLLEQRDEVPQIPRQPVEAIDNELLDQVPFLAGFGRGGMLIRMVRFWRSTIEVQIRSGSGLPKTVSSLYQGPSAPLNTTPSRSQWKHRDPDALLGFLDESRYFPQTINCSVRDTLGQGDGSVWSIRIASRKRPVEF